MTYFEYGIEDYIPCEVCKRRAVDIHHIECRGMGGTNIPDDINNLMALCRDCHIKYGDKKEYIEFLKQTHQDRLYNCDGM
jgi:hypothetical protein